MEVDVEEEQRLVDNPANNPVNIVHTRLNYDCLACIFKFLPLLDRLRVETVCRVWRQASRLAWNDIQMLDSDEIDDVNDMFQTKQQFLMAIIRRAGPYLRELRLSGDHVFRSFDYSYYCFNLTTLVVHFNHCTNNVLPHCLSRLRKLQSLKIYDIDQTLPITVLQSIKPQYFENLYLDALVCSYLPDTSPSVFNNFTNLKTLYFHHFRFRREVLNAIGDIRSLTSLTLTNCRFDYRNVNFVDHLRNLEHIDLKNAQHINDQLLMELSINCPNVKILAINHCMGITNAGIAALRMLTKLEVLDVGYLYEITDEPFGELHSLKRLICNTNSFVGNKGMIELVKNAHNLEYMNLLNTGIDENLIISVAEAVNRRRNNVQLEIRVTCNLERQWSQDVYPLLRVVRQHGPLPGPYDEAFWLERPHLVERLARMGELPHPIVNNIADDSESDNSDMEMNEDGADEEEEELEEEEEPEEYDYVQIYDDLD